ncbi:hypothetical protein AYO38_01485 [bacterium SCGC AG-212-C10]|nr:hypothetical protein AYO38_01485 [bacterium SCGC AG-212-C10]
MFGDDGRILDANETLARWLHRTRRELQDQHIDLIFPPGGRIFYQTHFFPLLRSSGSVSEIYFALRTAENVEIPVLITAVRESESAQGVCLATFVIINSRHQFEGALLDSLKKEHDAREESERKSNELDALNAQLQARLAELATMEEALRRSNAAKDEFIGLVSHELKNPLAILAGTMSALARRVDDLSKEQMREHLADLQREYARLLAMIDSLLVVARSEITDIELEPVLLQRLVPALVARERAQFPATDIVVEVEGSPSSVLAEEGLVEQILSNLISNARKYGTPQAPIMVTVRSEAECVSVSVANEGAVLSAEVVARFSEPFYRAPESRRMASGVGLGLTVCERLADAQGATIAAHPREGGGLTIALSFPVLRDEDEAGLEP